jgi:hypothetical protein
MESSHSIGRSRLRLQNPFKKSYKGSAQGVSSGHLTHATVPVAGDPVANLPVSTGPDAANVAPPPRPDPLSAPLFDSNTSNEPLADPQPGEEGPDQNEESSGVTNFAHAEK